MASLAQWQSTGLVNQGSRVQIPHEAVLFGLVVCLITFDASERNLFSCGTSLQLTVMQFRLQLERWNATEDLFWRNSINIPVASLAQWQSTGLVNQGSRVQLPHEAVASIRMLRGWKSAVYSDTIERRLLPVTVLCLFQFFDLHWSRFKILPFLAVKRHAKRSFPVPSLVLCSRPLFRRTEIFAETLSIGAIRRPFFRVQVGFM